MMQRGTHHTPAARLRLSQAATGRVFTDAHRERISAAAKRREAKRRADVAKLAKYERQEAG